MVVGNCEGDELSNSNRGAVSVDFFTPGALVRALNLFGVPIASGGTSAAAAVTTGVSSLIWTANPNMTPVQIKQKLMTTVDVLPMLEGTCVTGGRINAARALTGADCD